MVWRVLPSHKRLQARMEHMRRFRRHHEQLRTVMLRVYDDCINIILIYELKCVKQTFSVFQNSFVAVLLHCLLFSFLLQKLTMKPHSSCTKDVFDVLESSSMRTHLN